METFPDSYDRVERLAFHSAERAWTGLSAFLLAQSVLALAWAAIYATEKELPAKSIILLGLALAGVITGLQWSMLGTRMWQFHLLYMKNLKEITPAAYQHVIYKNVDEEIARVWRKDSPLRWMTKWSANHYIQLTVPLILSTVHAVMFGVILWHLHSLGPYLTVVFGVAYAMSTVIVWSICHRAMDNAR